jgi:hypothetical protein
MAKAHNVVPINARIGHEDDNTITAPREPEVTVKTDHKWKPFLYTTEVPDGVLNTQFNHLEGDDIDGFFKYRGWWYHLSDFMTFGSPSSPLAKLGWHAYTADSYFSGVVIKLDRDCERYQIGTYYS